MQSSGYTHSRQAWFPHDHQKRGITLGLKQNCALLLDPGLGKTTIALAIIKILIACGYIKRVLIVAPKNVMLTVWSGEINKWADFCTLSYTTLHGPEKNEKLLWETDIHIINPEGLDWFFKQTNRLDYDMLIVDESTKFKDSQTQRFKLLRKHIHEFVRRIVMTGTVIPNGLTDLFGQIFIVDRGAALGEYVTHYRNQYFYLNDMKYTPLPGAFEQIVDKVKPMCLRLAAEDYLKMPKLIKTNIMVELPAEAMKVYRKVELEYFAALEQGSIVAGNAAVAGGKCRQIANGAVFINESEWVSIHEEKLDMLDDLLEEIGEQPTLIFYEYTHDVERIQKRHKNWPSISGMSTKRLQDAVKSFNSGTIPRLLAHPASAGHGLNLQGACHHIVWFGIPWNLDYYIQGNDRVYRQGQTSDTVFVYHLVGAHTRDEKVSSVLIEKDVTLQLFNRAITEI